MPNYLSKNELSIKGTLLQPKINVPRSYEYVYDDISGWNVTNLTIINKMGRVLWPGVINVEGVDFSQDVVISEGCVDMEDKFDFAYDKIITVNTLPASVEQVLPNENKAK